MKLLTKKKKRQSRAAQKKLDANWTQGVWDAGPPSRFCLNRTVDPGMKNHQLLFGNTCFPHVQKPGDTNLQTGGGLTRLLPSTAIFGIAAATGRQGKACPILVKPPRDARRKKGTAGHTTLMRFQIVQSHDQVWSRFPCTRQA